MQQNTATEQET